MSSINFRTKTFNEEVDQYIQGINRQIILWQSFDEEQVLNTLFGKLKNYYKYDRAKDYPTDKEAATRAEEVLSEYQQDLVYFAYHNVKNKFYVQRLVANLIKCPNFHSTSSSASNRPKIIVWIDPKEGYTALLSLVRSDDMSNIHG